ncbi:hypothetical protein CCACVL1_00678, partial [Corchorus capsularis]
MAEDELPELNPEEYEADRYPSPGRTRLRP